MTFEKVIAKTLSPEEAIRHRWAQVQANISYDQAILQRMRENAQPLRTSAQKARRKRIQDRLQVEIYKRDEIRKIARLCELELSLPSNSKRP